MAALKGDSATASVPAVSGINSAQGGIGVAGTCQAGDGVRAVSTSGNGLSAFSDSNVGVFAQSKSKAGVFATSDTDVGVVGISKSNDGVRAISTSGNALSAFSDSNAGVFASTKSSGQYGVFGSNEATVAPIGGGAGGAGVFGLSASPGAAGVFGSNSSGQGVGVQGNGPDAGVSGFSAAGAGVRAHSNTGTAIQGFAHANDQSGIFGINDASGSVPDGLNRPAGVGVWGHTKVEKGSGVVGSVEGGLTQAAGVTGIGAIAGKFFGDVIVTGDVKLTGADLAEHFEVTPAFACGPDTIGPGAIEPGTVVVLDGVDRVRISESAYDRRVAGVVSGGGGYRPGVVLDHQGGLPGRQPLALVGKVFCKVDASYGAIEIGDMLTTSPTPGHAMKASDPTAAFGAVLGKAMAPIRDGKGLIPILVALQ